MSIRTQSEQKRVNNYLISQRYTLYVRVVIRTFTTTFPNDDTMSVRFRRRGKEVLEYSVQYNAFIEGAWHAVTRFDAAHGVPHRHVFHLVETSRKDEFPGQNLNDAFSYAQETVKREYENMRKIYVTVKRRQV